MGRRRTAELVLARDGQWVIVYPFEGAMERVITGQVDPALADLDFAAWRRTGQLDPSSQLWVQASKRMRNSVTQRRAPEDRVSCLTIMRMLMEQGYRCALTGHEFVLEDNGRHQPWQPSVDRVDSAKGYAAGNLRVVCLIVNMALGAWGEEPLREMAALLVTPG